MTTANPSDHFISPNFKGECPYDNTAVVFDLNHGNFDFVRVLLFLEIFNDDFAGRFLV